MPTYDHTYGELLTSREVGNLTGFTMNQLRNHRQKPETSPLAFIRFGATSLYRLSDVNQYLETSGGPLSRQYIVPTGIPSTPLNFAGDNPKKRADIAQLGQITTANSFMSMATWAVEKSGLENGTKLIHDEGRRLLALERGIDDWKTIDRAVLSKLGVTDLDAFWKIWTYGVRRCWVIVSQSDITDQELMAIPVGAIPPLKQH